MTTAENEAIVRRYIDLGNQHDLDTQYNMVSADGIFHMITGDLDVSTARQVDDVFAIGFPDMAYEIIDLITQGDLGSCRVIVRGTNLGPMPEGPAAGKKIELNCSWWFRFAEGKIAEWWEFYDQLVVFRQLGLNPIEEENR